MENSFLHETPVNLFILNLADHEPLGRINSASKSYPVLARNEKGYSCLPLKICNGSVVIWRGGGVYLWHVFLSLYEWTSLKNVT